jgi:hypothetical protein
MMTIGSWAQLTVNCCCWFACLQVHSKSDEANKYLVVLDAAAHAASHVLDLSQVTPDFVTLSFYKVGTTCIIGTPTPAR